MSLSFADFWKLAVESKLLVPQQCQQLHQDFSQVKGAVESGSAKTLAEWLVSRNIISRYQATILLAGRPGPFVYGDYRIYERIETGRLSGSFRAVHGPTGHPVLLQFLTGDVTRDPQRWGAAAREGIANCNVQSPHLQRWLDVVDLTTFKFLVGEDLRGESVDARIKAGRIAPQDACRWIIGAAQGLSHLHNEGRVHGEVRPGNLWLDTAPQHPGQLKLLRDPLFEPRPLRLDDLDASRGDYLAPEFLQAGKEPDILTDLYALGCTAYALLAGTPPFAGGTLDQKMRRHATEAIRPLEQFGVPQPVAQLVAYLMAKNPAVRYQQASVVVEQIKPFVDPAILYLPPPSPPATLPAYEAWVQQKRSALATSATLKPSAVPPVGVAVKEGADSPAVKGPGLDFGKIDIGGKSTSAAASVQTKDAASSSNDPRNLKERADKDKTKQIIYGLVAAGVLGIVALIAINASTGSGQKQVTENVPVVPSTTSGPTNHSTTVPPTTTTATNTNNTSAGNGDSTTKPPMGDPAGTPNQAVQENNGNNPAVENTSPPAGPVKTTPVGLQQTVVPDDGNLLWASPTSGIPIDLSGVPPEGQVFLALRPASFVNSPEGENVFHSLGPALVKIRDDFEQASGFQLTELNQMIVTFHNNDGKFPRVSIVAYPVEDLTQETLLAKLGNPSPQQEKEGTFYQGKTFAYSFPPAASGKSYFVMSDAATIKDGLSQIASPPILRMEVERLRRTTDADRHLSILFYPNFLANNDGAPLFDGGRERARSPLLWLLGDDLQAGAFSMHVDSQFYWELRFISSLSRDKIQLAGELRDRLEEIPEKVLTYISDMNPPPYWRKLAIRFPPMISQLHAFTRVGVEEDSAVLNGVLPSVAAHNLILGTELAIATAPGAGGGTTTAATEKPMPKTVEEVLSMKTSFAFDNTSLEFAMRDLAAETGELIKGAPVEFAIRILGNDLQLDGITRNMSIRDFKQDQKSVADILTALVMKTSVITDPASPEQKLIWVVAADPDNPSKQVVLITTRKKAAERGNKLPEIFVEKKS